MNDTTNIATLIEIATEAGVCFDVRYKGEVTFISQDALVRFARAILASCQEQPMLALQNVTPDMIDAAAEANRLNNATYAQIYLAMLRVALEQQTPPCALEPVALTPTAITQAPEQS